MGTSYRRAPRSPESVLYVGCTLSATERLVYLGMVQLADGSSVQASVAEIMAITGLSRSAVIRARDGLVKANAIKLLASNCQYEDGGRAPNHYMLTAKHREADASPRASDEDALGGLMEELGAAGQGIEMACAAYTKGAVSLGVYGRLDPLGQDLRSGWLFEIPISGGA